MSIAKYLNHLATDDCRRELSKCCGAEDWVEQMLARRPFSSGRQVLDFAESIWNGLGRNAWLSAFSAHPRIGDIDSLRAKFSSTKAWASGEQAGVAAAKDDTIRRLAAANDEYVDRFGYIFIICASGKSADEMLSILESRLQNPPELELAIAAAEQLKITQLRLKKLSANEQSSS